VFKPEFNGVVVHASLLPNGKVLYWGRRRNPKADPPETLDQKFTDAFLWDPPPWVAPTWDAVNKKLGDSKSTPISGVGKPANKGRGWDFSKKALKPVPDPPLGPLNLDGQKTVNLFCSGHCFLPDGNLLVTGGHIEDSLGLNQACVYDYQANEFRSQAEMNNGRWYPSALPLPDGRVLVVSGSYGFKDNQTGKKTVINNHIPQIWSPDDPKGWTEVAAFPDQQSFPMYPRVHLDPNGRRIFMAGPLWDSWFLELKDDNNNDIKTRVEVDGKTHFVLGEWKHAGIRRKAGPRDYAPSVMYDTGKILYIGGGNGDGGPTTEAEYIDLNVKSPKWNSAFMENPRRQFNATVLPDGTVLVTGGTRADGFNTLAGTTDGLPNPVHEAELWNPVNQKFTKMAKENSDRCYHSIALLLPDGRVLSAGGGEYGDADPDPLSKPPKPQRNLTDGQLFEPPYLFKGPRPTIVSAPKEINYRTQFPITVGPSDSIKDVSLVRLGSVTHCRNMNQSLMFLKPFTPAKPTIMVPAPASPNLAPPGHYMLFVLNTDGVPSVASIVRVAPAPLPAKTSTISKHVADIMPHTAVARQVQPTLLDHDQRIIAEQARPPVVVGLTPICPYGLGGCWAGAHEALQRLSDIDVVRPVPDQNDAVAFVYLQRDILPDIDVWRSEFERVSNKGYDMRGIEMTLSGVVTREQSGASEKLTLGITSTRPQLTLGPFQATSQLKWDITTQAPRPVVEAETEAYKRLSATLADYPTGVTVQVTGTLQKHGADEFSLDVRDFEVQKDAAS
jgi:galactose oxidase